MTKILLVEDDKSLREIYGVRLLAEGYDIVSAGDGEEALAMAIKEKPTLIISDVMMPKISGFDMLDILRSTTETRDIKVIMMTALSSEDQKARGEQLGSDRYLVKSQVGIEDVVRTVHEVLEDTPTSGETEKPAESTSATPAPDAQSTEGSSAPAPASTPAPAADDAAATDTTTDDKPAEEAGDDTTNSDAPAEETPAPEEKPAEPVAPPAEETPPAPTGNDESAGPLPPQPVDLKPPAPEEKPAEEPALPEPTAPFSSPAPTNLGEQVVKPIHDDPMNMPNDASDKINQALAGNETEAPVKTDGDDGSTPPDSNDTGVSMGPVEETPPVDTPAPAPEEPAAPSAEPTPPATEEKPTEPTPPAAPTS